MLFILIEDCKTPHQSNISASSISVTLSSGLPEGDLDLQSFIENGKSMYYSLISAVMCYNVYVN